MKNYEVYKYTFGMNPDITSCPTSSCFVCPIRDKCNENSPYVDNACKDWWNQEYKNPELEVSIDGNDKG